MVPSLVLLATGSSSADPVSPALSEHPSGKVFSSFGFHDVQSCHVMWDFYFNFTVFAGLSDERLVLVGNVEVLFSMDEIISVGATIFDGKSLSPCAGTVLLL